MIFMGIDRNGLIQLVQRIYSASPEYLWQDTPDACVFRHIDNGKWFGIIMSVSGQKIGLENRAAVDICNVKCAPLLLGSLLEKPSCFPAYHMNKKHWLTFLLDGSVSEEEVCFLLDMSYDLTAPKRKRKKCV